VEKIALTDQRANVALGHISYVGAAMVNSPDLFLNMTVSSCIAGYNQALIYALCHACTV
jgi:hypothetical protein